MFCLFCFFRKDIFTRIKTEQEEQKDQKRGKSIEVKQTEEDKISLLYKNDTFERWWWCMTKLFNLQFSGNKLVICLLKCSV